MLLDSHAHLTNEQMQEGLEDILLRASLHHVETIINIATNPEELKKGLLLQESQHGKKPLIYNAGSTTPHDAPEGDLYFEEFAECAREKKLVAIGETGLDYFYYKETKEIQQQLFRRYLDLANETALPVIIHCRDAFDDFFSIIDEKKVKRGVLHCFTGILEDAKKLVERGWMVSFSGIVTYKKSEELRQIAKWVPLENLLIETDSPYLAPQSFRGKKNEPSFIAETARCIADLKGLSAEEFARVTTQNGKFFFNL